MSTSLSSLLSFHPSSLVPAKETNLPSQLSLFYVNADCVTSSEISAGDFLFLEQGVKPLEHHLVVADIDGHITIAPHPVLQRSVPYGELSLMGVVTHVIHPCLAPKTAAVALP